MAHRRIQQLQLILNAQLFKLGTGRGIQLGSLAAEAHVDLVHIVHQIQRLLLADMLVECAAKVICNIIFAV